MDDGSSVRITEELNLRLLTSPDSLHEEINILAAVLEKFGVDGAFCHPRIQDRMFQFNCLGSLSWMSFSLLYDDRRESILLMIEADGSITLH